MLVPPPIDELLEGVKIQAIYVDDGLWYDAVVVKWNENGDCTVKFDEYDEKVTIPVHYIRHRPPTVEEFNEGSLDEAAKMKFTEVVTPGGFTVPDYLLPKEGDSLERRAQKKAKLAILKKAQIEKRITQGYEDSTNEWRKFVDKPIKKSRTFQKDEKDPMKNEEGGIKEEKFFFENENELLTPILNNTSLYISQTSTRDLYNKTMEISAPMAQKAKAAKKAAEALGFGDFSDEE